MYPSMTDPGMPIAWNIANRFATMIDKLLADTKWWIVPYAIPWQELSLTWGSQGHFSYEYLSYLAEAEDKVTRWREHQDGEEYL